MASQKNIRESQNAKDQTRTSRRVTVTDQTSQTNISRGTKGLAPSIACPIHDPKASCKCIDPPEQKSLKRIVSSQPNSRPVSRQTQTRSETSDHEEREDGKGCSDCGQHRCRVRLEPTTSCESHFMPDCARAAFNDGKSRKSTSRAKTIVIEEEESSESLIESKVVRPTAKSFKVLEESDDESIQAPRRSTKEESRKSDGKRSTAAYDDPRKSAILSDEASTDSAPKKTSTRQSARTSKNVDDDSQQLRSSMRQSQARNFSEDEPKKSARASKIDKESSDEFLPRKEVERPSTRKTRVVEATIAPRTKNAVKDETDRQSKAQIQMDEVPRRSKSRSQSRRSSARPIESDDSFDAPPRRSTTARKSTKNSGSERLCSATSGNESLPHICTRETECKDECSTHLIKNIDASTRICGCAKKHPELFDDIKSMISRK